MKIAIPTNDKLNIIYHLRFAHGFMILEIEDGSIRNKYYRNLSETNYMEIGNSEIKYARITNILSDCDLIILYAMNPEIEQVFRKEKIEIFVTSEVDIQRCIKLYLQGKLTKVDSHN